MEHSHWPAFGEYVRNCRDARRMSAEEAAEKASITRQQLNRIERGLGGTRRDTVLRLAAALDMNMQDALRRAGYSETLQIETGTTDELSRRLEPIRNRLPSDVRKRFDDYLVKQASDAADLLAAA